MKMSLMVLVLGDTLDGEMLATERPTAAPLRAPECLMLEHLLPK
jgi:hypothetical protein